MTKVNFHGILEKQLGAKTWRVSVKNFGEAMNAINILSGRKLFPQLLKNDNLGIKYEVLINDNPFQSEKPLLDVNDSGAIKNSELMMENSNLKTIDIIPIIEGAEDILSIVVGAILVVVGIILIKTPFGAPLILGGIGLIAAGVINLLSSPPEFDDFKNFGNQRLSYLFNGPQNTTREGGPIPLVYGELIVGSLVASASFDISDTKVGDEVDVVPADNTNTNQGDRFNASGRPRRGIEI